MRKSAEQLEKEFEDFHTANPHIWETIELYANKAISNGVKRWSMRSILEVIRWDSAISTSSRGYKVNDHLSPYYARHWNKVHPEYEGFFALRKTKGEKHV